MSLSVSRYIVLSYFLSGCPGFAINIMTYVHGVQNAQVSLRLLQSVCSCGSPSPPLGASEVCRLLF